MPNLGDRLYQSFAEAETGGVPNPWIRTQVAPPEGSTAYGPVQITRTLAEEFQSRHKDLFTREEKDFLKRFIQQGRQFAKFGNEPNRSGYDPRYDYGGEGDLTSQQDRQLYEQVAKKMLLEAYNQNAGDLEATIKEWRFGAASQEGRQQDQRYFTTVEDTFTNFIPTPTPSQPTSRQQQFAAASEARETPSTGLPEQTSAVPQGQQTAQQEAPQEPSEDRVDRLAKLLREEGVRPRQVQIRPEPVSFDVDQKRVDKLRTLLQRSRQQ